MQGNLISMLRRMQENIRRTVNKSALRGLKIFSLIFAVLLQIGIAHADLEVIATFNEKGGPKIEFTLKNISSAPISIADSLLPSVPYLTTLVAIRPNDNVPLTILAPPIVDKEPHFHKIAPGNYIKTNIHLDEKFENFKKIHLTEDIILFWSYELSKPPSYHGTSISRQGGWIFIPKQTKK